MPAKFFCPKCGRRFVDWGAEKLGYLCPSCEGEKLLKVGAKDGDSEQAPTLKRKSAKTARRPSKKAAVSGDVLADASDGGADLVELPDDDNDADGEDDDTDVLAADGGAGSSLEEVSGFQSVDQDD